MSRVFLITGANRGIGFAILRSLSQQAPEHTYILGVRSLPSGDEARQKVKEECPLAHLEGVELDITSDDSIRRAADVIKHRYGRLDCLVNNAGIGLNPKPDQSDFRAIYNQVFDTNVTSIALTTNLFLPLLSQSNGPRVINVSSARGSVAMQTNAKLPPTASIPYTVSKTALNITTLEMAKLNPEVMFHVVSPGHCKTAFNGYRGKKDPLDGAKNRGDVRMTVGAAFCT
ncbi:NAD(P)-binding protein [Rhizodiscina lignyota]|uniref:NAD(P)-binding protein n=1 Tax=Rhizodiscina lignyota TaxID=1504668 RepID=A0A9P4IQU7_9PEZI|nr:NAD(P)-binding protein [Rhizodiscina lignyota]